MPTYPTGTVRALLDTDHVSPATRTALRTRIDRMPPREPVFFSEHEFTMLRSLCARLIPQPDRSEPIEIAGEIDRRLADGSGDGWRFDTLPPDGEMYLQFLDGLDQLAQDRGANGFAALDEPGQDAVLTAVQRGEARAEAWDRLPASRCFEEVLAEVTEVYYAHPLAQEEIGYVGMADLPGWSRIGLNERDEREPGPLEPA